MLNEPSFVPQHGGGIEVNCGGMFSSKTEELIRRAKRAQITGQQVFVVKPAIENQYSEEESEAWHPAKNLNWKIWYQGSDSRNHGKFNDGYNCRNAILIKIL